MTNTRVSPCLVDGPPIPALDGLRILVVDDDESQTEMYVFALERLGAVVAGAASAEEAFDALGTEPYDVVVSDVALPACDGYELVRVLRATGLTLPAVAVTGWSEPGERDRALAAGFDEFCTKPCLPSELALVIRRIVRATRASHAPATTLQEPR